MSPKGRPLEGGPAPSGEGDDAIWLRHSYPASLDGAPWPVPSAPGLNPLGKFAEGLSAGAVSNLMSNGDDDRHRPVDNLEHGHEGEPHVPGEARICMLVVRGGARSDMSFTPRRLRLRSPIGSLPPPTFRRQRRPMLPAARLAKRRFAHPSVR